MDALTLLTHDHRMVESLFGEFQAASSPDIKKQCVDKMVMELSIHAAIEELKFYPRVKQEVSAAGKLIDESLHEHQKIKNDLAELERMSPEDTQYEAKVHTLMNDVKHHVQEEETELFPKVRTSVSGDRLTALGAELEEAKKAAPTHPHPMAPKEGAAGAIAGMAAGAMDRARDMAHPDEAIREEVREQGEEARRDR